MAFSSSRKSKPTNSFPVQKRKEMGRHLHGLYETQLATIAEKAIEQVRENLHVKHFRERSEALNDPAGQQELTKCVEAMCTNFGSFYSSFLPRKQYTNFQHAWFMHIRQYITGVPSNGVPSAQLPVKRTRSGRVIKDQGDEGRVEASKCKGLWDNFIRSLSSPITIQNQEMILSSLVWSVYDHMICEVKRYKENRDILKLPAENDPKQKMNR